MTAPPIIDMRGVHVASATRRADPSAQRAGSAGHRRQLHRHHRPSGCGKTTILNLLADVVAPTSGTVLVEGQPPAKSSARAGYMLARDALLPWRSVRRNVELPLDIRGGVSAERRRAVATELLSRVGLAGYEERAVKQLSHGMRQRVSLARILAFDPDMPPMDEPFIALDAQTRMRAGVLPRGLAARPQDRAPATHDISEAIFMADQILVFSARPATLLETFPSTSRGRACWRTSAAPASSPSSTRPCGAC